MKKSLLASLLLCFAMFGDSPLASAETLGPVSAELFERLEKSGWETVSPGVMQRAVEGDQVETLGFGEDGLRFRLEEMRAHLAFLRKELALYPSRELRAAIRAHRAEILRVQTALKKADAAGGLELANESLVAAGANCSANYDAAAVLPPGGGVSATSSASFTNPCGYTGEVYAHAYTRVTTPNDEVITMTRSDPALNTSRIGTNVSASAAANVNGVRDCYAYAYSSVTSYDLGITHSQSATSSVCPEQTPYYGTPFAVPGRINAADFDNGGEGIAYHDLTSGNLSVSSYRKSDVDMYGETVYQLQAGEWIEYTINVGTAGVYSVVAEVGSSTSGGSFHIELDGVNATGPIAVPNTGSWSRQSSAVKAGVSFPAGRHVLRLAVDAGFDALYSLRIVVVRMPFGGTPKSLPGTVRVSDFDEGGEQLSYHDNTAGCDGSCGYRKADVDRWDRTVYKTQPGEWMEYTVNVTTAGTYTLSARVAADAGGGVFHVEFDGVNVTGPLTFPTTGGWNVFQTITKTGVSLSAGKKVMRIVIDSDAGRTDAGSFDTITIQP
ncbi:MAG TPA: carbohydrate-binding protein [Thermoanaerobaculia bacterium]|nr:carbohydrate-binding protein [Thermoanaerobaculia bacterium]